MNEFKQGDHVLHVPSGETWVVKRSGVDGEGGYVEPAGWPACRARAADCEMVEAGASLHLFENSKPK